MNNKIISYLWNHEASKLMILYAGKASGIIINLLFIPFYSKILGVEKFGVVAVLISLQALLLMLDFGMANLITRDVAAHDRPSKSLVNLLKNAEFGLLLLYILLMLVCIILQYIGIFGNFSIISVVGSIALFFFLVLQNIYYCALVAYRSYGPASIIQMFGNLSRAIVTAVALFLLSPSIEVFIWSQLLVAAIHYVVIRHECLRRLGGECLKESGTNPSLNAALKLMGRGKSLGLHSAAGAAVLQLDKPIILYFMSSASVTPYFLAMTFCMVPLNALAGPVAQYFQPRFYGLVAQKDATAAEWNFNRFALILCSFTLVPAVLLWVFREQFVGFWLGGQSSVGLVNVYVSILMPGLVASALSFLPFTLLMSEQDYRFQAIASLCLTVVTLIATSFAAYYQSGQAICIVYASYFVISAVLIWLRAASLRQTRKNAVNAAAVSVIALCVSAVAIWFFSLF